MQTKFDDWKPQTHRVGIFGNTLNISPNLAISHINKWKPRPGQSC